MIDFSDETTRSELAEALPDEIRAGCLFAGGSIVEGSGNEKSDIDVICILETLPPLESVHGLADGHQVSLSMFRGTKVDTELVTVDRVRGLIEGLSQGDRHPSTISTAELTLMNNIFSGVVLPSGQDASRLRESFDREEWLRALLERCLVGYRNSSEDAQGAIPAENLWAAHYASQAALDFAVDSLTVSLGSTNLKSKWRVDRLTRLGQVKVVDEYWNAIALPDLTPETVLRVSRRRLLLAQRYAQVAGGMSS